MNETLIQAGLTVVIVILILYRDKKEKELLIDNFSKMFTALSESITKFHESVEKMQIAHFENLEKHSTRQLQILEKQTKDFLNQIQTNKELEVLGAPKAPPETISSMPISLENTIEKEEIPEIPLTEDMRIPIIEGVTKMKFEGDEEILNA